MSEHQGHPALVRAIKVLGSQGAVAAAVGIKQQTVSGQVKGGKPVPAEWCIPLDLATTAKGDRISCHDFRPDLWPADFLPAKDMAA